MYWSSPHLDGPVIIPQHLYHGVNGKGVSGQADSCHCRHGAHRRTPVRGVDPLLPARRVPELEAPTPCARTQHLCQQAATATHERRPS
jgi:hypothetical protein